MEGVCASKASQRHDRGSGRCGVSTHAFICIFHTRNHGEASWRLIKNCRNPQRSGQISREPGAATLLCDQAQSCHDNKSN